ncbi:immunoglobulin J chain isoform X1 [Ochotona curzoniae]|uniref:immunoglobulin J chain isoform X1 n=1 Tax=Ochotona curzoniae TaxID=130825 RepID=UPI001B34620C|nr:immunoglobulin J chain isoform X1 [Ochotona curzoniae]
MKNRLLLWGVLAIFVKAVLVTAHDEESTVLVDNKCKCVRVTSKIVPDPNNPNCTIVERNIRIVVPLNTRENITDPTSPLRTKFEYNLADICKKCDPTEVELHHQVFTASQSTMCEEDGYSETCYTYDRNKCYSTLVPIYHRGEIKMVKAALTPESCYPD